MPNTDEVSLAADRIKFLKRKAKSKKISAGLTTESATSLNDDGLHLKLDLINQKEVSFTLTHDSLEELDLVEMGSELREQFKDIVFKMRYVVQTELSRRKVPEISCSTMRQYPETELPSGSLFRMCLTCYQRLVEIIPSTQILCRCFPLLSIKTQYWLTWRSFNTSSLA